MLHISVLCFIQIRFSRCEIYDFYDLFVLFTPVVNVICIFGKEARDVRSQNISSEL